MKKFKLGVLGGASRKGGSRYFKVSEKFARFCSDNSFEVISCGASSGVVGVFVKGCADLGVVQSAIALQCESENVDSRILVVSYVDDIAMRKKLILLESDLIVVLPGGLGTFDEAIGYLSSYKAGEHKTPIFLCNQDGFYEPLLKVFEQLIDEGFLAAGFASEIKTFDVESFSIVGDFATDLSGRSL
ncbi:LOG family protein [Pseudomonas sp. RT6P73]